MKQSRVLLVSVAAVLLILALCSNVSAGQLHVRYHTLADIAAGHRGYGCALLGVVVGINHAAETLRLRIERVWVGKDGEARGHMRERRVEDGDTIDYITTIDYAVGDTVAISIHTGVVWDNPHKSPIDNRLWNHLEFSSIKDGQRIVIAGREALAADSSTLRKLDLFFDPAAMKAYTTDAPDAQLARDLADRELFDTAVTVLRNRGRALVPLLVAASRGRSGPHEPLSAYLDGLSGPAREGFWGKLVGYFRSRPGDPKLAEVADVLTYRIGSDDVPAVNAFLALVKESAAVPQEIKAELEKRVGWYLKE